MSYHALARKYRPATFAAVVGQQHVTTTLRAALRKDKLAHAYLFAGPRGCGKTTVARLLAKALNCEAAREGDPCGECETCRSIAAGSYLDVLEIDAASNTGVDNIRDLRDMAQYSPTRGGCRVFIIDEVHMLSKGAFNALLKILEEPPARVFFFFATTEPTRIPRTILSRCQRFDFRLLTHEELSARLTEIAAAEGAALAADGLSAIVSLAEGSLRDGLSILDQLIAAADGPIDAAAVVRQFGLVSSEVYTELNEAILARDPGRVLRLAEQLATTGQSLDGFAQGVVMNFRNLLVLRIDPQLSGLELAPEQIAILRQQAERFSAQDLLMLLDRAAQHYERIHRSTQPRILLEAALVEYTLFESRVLLSDLVQRLSALTGEDLTGGGRLPPAGGGGEPVAGTGDGRRRGRSGSTAARGAANLSPRDPARSRPRPAATVSPPDDGAATAGAGGTQLPAAAAGTVSGWTAFLESLLASHPGLASCLLEGMPSLDEAQRRVVITFPAEKVFQVRRLAQEQELLQRKVARSWPGMRLVLVTGGEENGQLRESIRQRIAPTEQERLEADCRQDAQLAQLVDLIEGEPVSAGEREAWLQARQEEASRPAEPDGAPPVERTGPDRSQSGPEGG
jgi:DNA polymerase-3 subunit gamma/tau